MILSDLANQAGEWLRGIGPMGDVVISSRVRLARNLAGMPFLSRCTTEQKREVEQRLRDEILHAKPSEGVFYVDIASVDSLDRQFLVERHLISRQHADTDHPRGVAVSSNESVAIMVNEEDHLRIQVLRSGLQLLEAFEQIDRIDDILARRLDYAYHSRYGYLTACPTNVGTGLRVSVMLHLPALKMTGEIEKALRAARDLRLAIRGLYGEGTEASGDFFQVSNQTTLGLGERQIVDDFLRQTVPQFVEYERRTRRALMSRQRMAVDDKIFRADALLRSAKLISSNETMQLLSLLRMGVNLELIKGLSIQTINELFLQTQPAHLQKINHQKLSGLERAQIRSQLIRQRLGGN